MIGTAKLTSCVRVFAAPCTAACQTSLSFTISWSLLKFMSIESVTPSNHLVPCLPLFLLPSVFPSIKVFSNKSPLHIRWPKYWSFSPSNEYSGLISFRIDWFDLLVVQGSLKGLLQHHSLKASIRWFSAFFMVQLSHLYMTAGKTIALTRWTFGGKVMSLIFFREILIPYLFMGSPYSPTMRNKTVCHQGYFKHQLFSLNHRSLSLT